MAHGFYFVVEGVDGAGKSSVTAAVAERLKSLMPGREIIATRHPGATPLGRHIRQLVKYPEKIDPDIEIDALTGQLLMVVDNASFVSTILRPAMERGAVVLADRSNFITSIAYGRADGLEYGQIDRMFRIAQPPRADRLYVLDLPWEVARERMVSQGGGDKGGLDRFERKGDGFFTRASEVYRSLVTGPPDLLMVVNHSVNLENVRYVDATVEAAEVAGEITRDICKVVLEAE